MTMRPAVLIVILCLLTLAPAVERHAMTLSSFDGSGYGPGDSIDVNNIDANEIDANSITLWNLDPNCLVYADVNNLLVSLAGGASASYVLEANGVDVLPHWAKPVHHLIFTITDPATVYTTDTDICIWGTTDAALTISGILVTCDANPATELDVNLNYADAFIGLANATLVHALDTTNGVFTSGAETLAVPSGKCLYLDFDGAPDAALTQINVDITFTYD